MVRRPGSRLSAGSLLRARSLAREGTRCDSATHAHAVLRAPTRRRPRGLTRLTRAAIAIIAYISRAAYRYACVRVQRAAHGQTLVLLLCYCAA